MSIKVKFDTILGRLREKDGDGGSPTPPSHSLSVQTTPTQNQTYLADAQQSPGMTVTVVVKFDGTVVDAASTPSGWTRTALGTYTRRIDQPGTVPAQQWTYVHEGTTYTATSPARSLTAIWPAYWGIYPSNDAEGDITAIVAALKDQHRQTSNLPTTVFTVDNPTGNDCWLWIVTKGTARATPEAFDISMMQEPVTGKTFASPMPGANWNLTGYKAYVSINRADAGLSFGPCKITINL